MADLKQETLEEVWEVKRQTKEWLIRNRHPMYAVDLEKTYKVKDAELAPHL